MFRKLAAATFVLALSACATSSEFRDRENAELARFETHAGAPIERINTYTGLDHWRSLAPATDLYALGCLAWCLVTGEAPFAVGPSGAGLVVRASW